MSASEIGPPLDLEDHIARETPNYDLWQRAKNEQPQCERCKWWDAEGLSYHCPSCDEPILARYDALVKARERNKR
jgi:hypothetical protein